MTQINELSYAYPKKVLRCKWLNLTLKPGSIKSLLGANSACKTPLLKLLAGMLSINDGNILVKHYLPFETDIAFLKDLYFVPE
jgi:ABC-type uncharacterized transport system ATPase subunit